MFSLFKRKAPRDFVNLMKRADQLTSNGNVEGLKDLIKIVLRPIQSKHLANAYVGDDHSAIAEINWAWDMGFKCMIDAQTDDALVEERDFITWCNSDECRIRDKNVFPVLNLSSDIVLPTPWHPSRILQNIGAIGKGRRWGEFQQDFTNHCVVYHYPLMIGWVSGGNHSIMQGILGGDATLVPDEVHDLTVLIDSVEYNGDCWISRSTGHRLGSPRYPEFGWCWEIARRIKSLQPSPFDRKRPI